MLFTIVLFALLIVLLFTFIKLYQHEKAGFKQRKIDLADECSSLEKQDKELTKKISEFEKKTSQLFAFYDTARAVAPLVQREKIIDSFIANLNSLEDVERVSLSKLKGSHCHSFELGPEEGFLYLKTQSFAVLLLAPIFAKLLSVCFERLRLYRRLQELSIHDYLTGVYNRRYFTQRLKEEFLRAEKLNHNLSFLMLDIDNFKKINDTYGHLVGDAVLKRCTFLVSESIRQIDFVGRLGGEEFGVLLLDTDKAGAIMVSERICSRISEKKIRVFDEEVALSVSIGVSVFPSNTKELDLLSEIADKALLRAKASGKDRVCWF